MNAPLDLRMDKATFLRWILTRPGRYELVGGRVVMQDTGTRDHSAIGLAFWDRRGHFGVCLVFRHVRYFPCSSGRGETLVVAPLRVNEMRVYSGSPR